MKYITSIIIGLLGNLIIELLGMKFGIDGIKYYGEIHTTILNKLIHCLCMPFTLYGILLLFPTLFFNKIHDINKFKKQVFIIWIIHYFTIDVEGSILTLCYTFPSLYYSIIHQSTKLKTIIRGLFFMVLGLVIQEIFGHYISGDLPSRIEAIPNAIIYAPYFGINGFFL